ncbi:MAG TPA: di-heme oxidoredictase family protein [Candidatus Angelobacter sp.]|nr:di-heme oxidoredictase family protein [Candidatus Angelobacter sp.]
MKYTSFRKGALVALLAVFAPFVHAQLVDNTQATNTAKAGINKSLADEIGPGRGDIMTPNSSLFIINRDPFRAVRRGRQIFQRKFTRAQGQGPNNSDGTGNLNLVGGIGAGLSDSCAGCHGRPRGAAGSGGDVATRPDSRDAPHLFGLGLKEMLADEMTADMRAIRAAALVDAQKKGQAVTRQLLTKGVSFGSITANRDGSVDTSQVRGVNADLRVRPFFAEGSIISIREFLVGAFRNEMGMEAADPDLLKASAGGRVVTPSGMVLDGSLDKIDAPPITDNGSDPDGDGVNNELPTSIIDHEEYYLLHYFKPAVYEQNELTRKGRKLFDKVGCGTCHVADMLIEHDRRVADLETVFDPVRGNMNHLFATATASLHEVNDNSGFPTIKVPNGGPFLVKNIFTDFKRHDLGANFYERNYDGTLQKQFLTRPLWGVGSTSPYGHDGRSINLHEVILRHGGESQASRDAYAKLEAEDQGAIQSFLNSLVLFPPDDTASTLDPGVRTAPNFPQFGHGSIRLTVLFNDPTDPE